MNECGLTEGGVDDSNRMDKVFLLKLPGNSATTCAPSFFSFWWLDYTHSFRVKMGLSFSRDFYSAC